MKEIYCGAFGQNVKSCTVITSVSTMPMLCFACGKTLTSSNEISSFSVDNYLQVPKKLVGKS